MGRRGELRRKLRYLNRNYRSLVGIENTVKTLLLREKRGYFLAIFPISNVEALEKWIFRQVNCDREVLTTLKA